MSTAAPAAPALLPFDRASKAFQQRWWTLGVLCLALLIIIVDNSILNVAIPTLVRDLDASNSQLQWMVDSYTLVFAGLLLTAGSLGDRFGRRGALQLGLTIFGVGSLASALSGPISRIRSALAASSATRTALPSRGSIPWERRSTDSCGRRVRSS